MPTWSTTSDWDGGTDRGAHHEQPSNTDWASSDKLEKGNFSSVLPGKNPVFYTPYEETSGSTANDISGNNNDGTIDIGISQGENGVLGSNCFGFDAADNDNVEYGDISALEDISALTVGFWVYFATLGVRQELISKGDPDGNDVWAVRMGQFDQIIFYIDGSSNAGTMSYSWGPSTNTWYHVACVYDSNNDWESSDTAGIYIDGVLQKKGSPGSGTIDTTPEGIQVGTYGEQGNDPFDGRIDEVFADNDWYGSGNIEALYEAAV